MKRIVLCVAAMLLSFAAHAESRTTQNALSTSPEIVCAAQARDFCEIKNLDASITIYVGFSSSITSSTGHAVKAGEAFIFDEFDGDIWAVAASATPSVSTVEW